MKSKATWMQTCFLHSARGSSDRGVNPERLLQRWQDARQLLKKMAWIHAFFLETPVSSPQGYVEDALSSASHGGVSDSRTARLSRKIRCGIRNREPNFFGAFGTKSALYSLAVCLWCVCGELA